MQSEFNPRRRMFVSVLAGLAILGAPLLRPAPAVALEVAEAEALIEAIVEDTLSAMNSNESEAQILERFVSVLETYADLPIMARSTLGVAWRQANDEQRRAFISAYTRYLAFKYGKNFRPFRNSRVQIRRSMVVKSGVLVETIATRSGAEPVAIDWQISDKSGRARVFNLYIEGVSMLSIERQEIGQLFEQAGRDIDSLIAELQSRN